MIGFFDNSKEPYIYSLNQLNVDIQAVVNRVSANEVVIELSVPLSLIKKTNKKGMIGIGIETNTIDLQELISQGSSTRMGRSGGMQRSGGMRGTGRMSQAGAMRMPRGGGQGRGQLQELNDPVSVWSQVQLHE